MLLFLFPKISTKRFVFDRTESALDEFMSPGEMFATESKQVAGNASLSSIADDVKPLSGAGAAGSVTLALANTWYAVPSVVPASDYILIVAKETAVGTWRYAFANVVVPSATYGNRFTTEDMVVELAASGVIYIGSTSAADVVNWTTKII